MTPDRLIGRVVSVSRNIGIILTPFGALAAGLLLDAFSARTAIAVFAALSVVLAVWGTASPSIRKAPSLESLIGADAPV